VTTSVDFDVVIAGAGPAGCATAISLADFAPELRVCLVDGSVPDAVQIGETVPPPIRRLLEHVGLWQRFAADGHCPSYRTVSAWGGPRLASNEFLFHAQQVGWRLDRVRFDAMLRHAAAERIAAHVKGNASAIRRVEHGWRLVVDGDSVLTARFTVDATGRAAALARSSGLRAIDLDRLVGCYVVFRGGADDGEGAMIETFADGWWYTAAIPGGRRVVACMTDADLVRSLGIRRDDGFMRVLDQTNYVRAATVATRASTAPMVRPAGSRLVTAVAGLPLLCVGDAASSFDPVSGQGIYKALRSGIFASYAIADLLRRNDESGIARYRTFVADEYSAYRETLRDYYALEQRWPDRPFWRRRHAAIAVRQQKKDAAVGA
jgi:flavin-dependent dehydrogenase